jgi:hypothetical protein
MTEYQAEVIRDAEGRETVRFTTPCGVSAIIATCIPHEALESMERSLTRMIATDEARRAISLAGERSEN